MQTGVSAAAVVAAFGLLCACRGDAAVNAGVPTALPLAEAGSLPLIWQGADRLRILCIVQGGEERLRDDLCARVLAAAGTGAPVPVESVAPGDPAVLDPGGVSLLVHASVATEGDERVLAFTVRPYRAGRSDTDILFGAAPRVVRLPQSGAGSPALDAALRAALAETLPWLERRRTARPIGN